MKKIKHLFFFLAIICASSVTATENNSTTEPTPNERVEQLRNRVNEIWEMDFSDMEKEDKIEVKNELKEIKKELKEASLDKKVSISIGAIIIILLLIIIIS